MRSTRRRAPDVMKLAATITCLLLTFPAAAQRARTTRLAQLGRVMPLPVFDAMAIGERAYAFASPAKGQSADDTEEVPACSVELIQPTGETLIHPYKDRLDSLPHTIPFVIRIQGLPAGLHSLRLSVEGAGGRTLWYWVTEDETVAVFRGDVPVPPGPYRITLSLPEVARTPPIAVEGKLPSYPYAPTKEDLDEWIAFIAGWEEQGKDVAVAWGLCNLGRDYYLLGMLDKAQESLHRALAIYDRDTEDPERLRNACQILARIHLLRGDTAAMNAACERWLKSEPTSEEIARFTFDWAQSRALLETAPSSARRLWESAIQHATAAGIEIPPSPPWAVDHVPVAHEGVIEKAKMTGTDTPIEPARLDEQAERARYQEVTRHDTAPHDVPVAREQVVPATDQVVLEDDFDSENSGRGSLCHRGFSKWLVPLGEVDLVGNGFHDVCPGHGLYVDLGGTGEDEPAKTAGMLQSREMLRLVAGRYRVSFDMMGSKNAKISVRVGSLGSVYKGSFVAGRQTAFEQRTVEFAVGEDGEHKLTFVSEGSEPSVLIDNIKLERLQAPQP
jgi:hypothetical protein